MNSAHRAARIDPVIAYCCAPVNVALSPAFGRRHAAVSAVANMINNTTDSGPEAARDMRMIPFTVDLQQQEKRETRARYDKGTVSKYGDILRAGCAAEGVQFLDLYKAFPQAISPCPIEELLDDGIHPTMDGYKIIAALIEERRFFRRKRR